jgi:hypothetical protein
MFENLRKISSSSAASFETSCSRDGASTLVWPDKELWDFLTDSKEELALDFSR